MFSFIPLYDFIASYLEPECLSLYSLYTSMHEAYEYLSIPNSDKYSIWYSVIPHGPTVNPLSLWSGSSSNDPSVHPIAIPVAFSSNE